MRNALYVALVTIAILVSTYSGFELSRAGTTSFWLIVGGPTLIIAAIGMARAYRDGDLRDWIRPAWGDATRGLLGAGAMFACAYGFAKMTSGGPKESWLARLYLQLGDPSMLRKHAVVIALMIIVVAAAEEIVWRGLVTSLLAEKLGTRTAWLYSAGLYALAHVGTLWALRDPEAGLNPVLPLAALGAGIIWGGMAHYLGRLFPVILAHALFDWLVVMTFRLWGVSV